MVVVPESTASEYDRLDALKIVITCKNVWMIRLHMNLITVQTCV